MSRTDAELRRKILEGLCRRLDARFNGQALRSKDRLELQSLSDQELESAVEQAVRVREIAGPLHEEAGRLRREIFHERAARRLKGGAR